MIYHLLIAILGIGLLMMIWLGVQLLEKRQSKLPSDCDVLSLKSGCLGCLLKGRCRKDREEGEKR